MHLFHCTCVRYVKTCILLYRHSRYYVQITHVCILICKNVNHLNTCHNCKIGHFVSFHVQSTKHIFFCHLHQKTDKKVVPHSTKIISYLLIKYVFIYVTHVFHKCVSIANQLSLAYPGVIHLWSSFWYLSTQMAHAYRKGWRHEVYEKRSRISTKLIQKPPNL